MLGTRNTLRLWRRRWMNPLSRERALKSAAYDRCNSEPERTVVARMISDRRFEVSKGRIRPPR